ncbi:MAG: hypothetical protein JST54_23745 [Deltaproteobacteria bacterium]|nr:hypothetical protein [Deltaproteobacteria bacterium]
MSATPCAKQRLVDLHFRAAIDPDQERELRAHLPTCDACRRRYGKQALLAKLDPAAPNAQDRLARGLGFSPRKKSWLQLPVMVPAGLAAAAALLVVVNVAHRPSDDGFSARGGNAPASVEVRAYRIAQGKSEPLAKSIPANAELAFAYANRADKRYLMIFGVDEHKHVYWFHPSWTDATQTPRAIAAKSTLTLEELPEAVSQHFDGRALHLVGLFLDQPMDVKQLEALVQAAPDGVPSPTGALTWRQDLEVAP